MTRYAFISHMEDYMKKLLKDPLKADTDGFLKAFGIDGPVALKMLMRKSDPDDEMSSIILRTEKIKDNGFDEDGKRNKDSFEITYKIPRKDYTKKMRNLFINLFEQNIVCEDLNYYERPLSSTPYPFKDKNFGKVQSQCKPNSTGDRFAKYVNDNDNKYEPKIVDDEKKELTEGAWGYGILDNDSALDAQSEFGEQCLNVLYANVQNAQDSQSLWSELGVLIDFLKKYKDDEIQFSDKYNYAVDLAKSKLNILFNDENFINDWSEPRSIKSSLKKQYKDVATLKYQKEIMNIDDPNKIDPFGGGKALKEEMGGATTCGDSSGQFDVPMSKPIKKQIYLTKEQVDYIKEATATSNAGNYQYDVPFGDKNDEFYEDAMDHTDMMKKSFEGD